MITDEKIAELREAAENAVQTSHNTSIYYSDRIDLILANLPDLLNALEAERARNEWQPIETAPKGQYVIINIQPLNYPVIAAQDEEGWMTRTGAFYGSLTASRWMPITTPHENGGV